MPHATESAAPPRASEQTAEPEPEPLTVEETDRQTILPVRHPDLWEMYKQMEGAMWTAQQVDFSSDRAQWDSLPAGQRAFYMFIFGMFARGDEKVLQNLGEQFCSEFKVKEAAYFFNMQAANEQAHSESYMQQVNVLFSGEEHARVLNLVDEMPAITAMMEWAHKWMNPELPLGTRLAGFACFEGGLFQGQFLLLQMLKERNLLPGVSQANDWISRDEALHCQFACHLLRRHVRLRPSAADFHRIVGEMAELFDDFVAEACEEAAAAEKLTLAPGEAAPCPVPGASREMLAQYIRYVADSLCALAGYPAFFNAANPFPELGKLSLNSVAKTNFFEIDPTQYSLNIDLSTPPSAERRRGLSIWA